MSETTIREPRRWSFWLIGSLCLNVFLLGVIVMGLIVARNRIAATAMGGAGGGGLRPDLVLQMLPQSGALKMCEALAARVPEFRKLGQDVVEARRAMFRVFRAEPFDEAAFRAALARVTEADIAVARAREATIADVVARLTPDERKHFTRQVAQRLLSLTRPAQGPRGTRDAAAIASVCKEIGAPQANELPQ
ncbi:MAG: periplasmic heavy metal sensor [Alphaproteobacteria bacterium]|nr:periplasmic heavy metal sensor [Alphaproteobacteria bacterium]